MPPLTTLEQELAEEEKALRAEQEWFLTTQVTTSLDAIQKALVACQDAARLQDDVMGALTLAISSPNNDVLKGFVTLSGSFIVKGELTIKLPKLSVVKVAIHSQIPVNISATQSLLTASGTASTGGGGGGSILSLAPSITGAPTGGAAVNTGETTSAETQATTEGAATPKTEDGQHLPPTALGIAAAIGTATGIGAGSLAAPTPAGASLLSNATTAAPSTAGSGTTSSVHGPQMNTHQLLHSYRPPGHVTQPYALEQLRDVQNHTAQAIYCLEDYRKWRGESTNVEESGSLDIKEITRALKTMLELLGRHIRASIEAMAQPGKEKLYPFRVCDPKIFSPALSEDFVIEFFIRDSQLVCAAYALQLSTGSSSSSQGFTGNALTTYLQQALPGASSASTPTLPQQVTMASTAGGSSSGTSGDHHQHVATSGASTHNGQTSGAGAGGRGGHGTPRPSSPMHHHNATSGHPSHTSHQSHLAQHSSGGGGGGNGAGGARATKPWSPTRSPSNPQVSHHPEPVVLPSSDKIGQTSKGGINKYRGKIATTLEDKVVQVQSPKLAEISTRLIQAENLCRRLVHFLVLQDSVAASPY